MPQRHRNVTPRIARMLREFGGAKTARGGAADVAELATYRGGYLRKRTAERWFKAAAALIAAGFVAVIAWHGLG